MTAIAKSKESIPEPFCCWLRPSPSGLSLDTHCTYRQITQVVQLQQWFPSNCHYCKYRPNHVDDYEKHIVKHHPGKMAYPGPTPEETARALYVVESIERELKEVKVERSAVAKAARLKKEQL
jgi:hypothetical protein